MKLLFDAIDRAELLMNCPGDTGRRSDGLGAAFALLPRAMEASDVNDIDTVLGWRSEVGRTKEGRPLLVVAPFGVFVSAALGGVAGGVSTGIELTGSSSMT